MCAFHNWWLYVHLAIRNYLQQQVPDQCFKYLVLRTFVKDHTITDTFHLTELFTVLSIASVFSSILLLNIFYGESFSFLQCFD